MTGPAPTSTVNVHAGIQHCTPHDRRRTIDLSPTEGGWGYARV